MSTICSTASAAAREPLGGTGMEASRWLCVESRLPWGRDAIVDGGFPPEVAGWLTEREETVLAIRRPGRGDRRIVVFSAETTETGGELRRLTLDRIDELTERDPWAEGEPVDDLLLLVCAHGRRDACCSRLGLPVFSALSRGRDPELVWQCSHTGGHRFAPNVVVLPVGVTLGRVEAGEVVAHAGLLEDGRIPLDRYRGRSVYDDAGQAAEVGVRRALGLDGIADVQLVGRDGSRVRFAAGDRVVEAVLTRDTVHIPKSCGADAEAVLCYEVEVG